MAWACDCGDISESRSQYLLHKGLCQSREVKLKNCESVDCSFQDNLKESGDGTCAFPITEEPFCDLITITDNVNDPQKILYDSLTPTEAPEGDVLPLINGAQPNLSTSLVEAVVDNEVIINTENSKQYSDYTSSFVEKPTTMCNEYSQLISDTLCDIPQDWMDNEDTDDLDADPDWSPTEDYQPRKRKLNFLHCLQNSKRRNILTESDSEDADDPGDPNEQVSRRVSVDTGSGENTTVTSELGRESTDINTISCTSNKKRKKGVRVREEEKRKKDQGLSYKTRSGKTKPPILFQPVKACCKKKKFYELVNSDTQRKIFENCYSLPINIKVRDQTLCERMVIQGKKTHSSGRGKTNNDTHNRVVTILYFLSVDGNKLSVCKTIFMRVYGVTRGKVDVLVEKLRAAPFGVIDNDMRGNKLPVNKTSEYEINAIHEFINKYLRHESHYARRDSSSKQIFLPSHLTIKKMYKEYLEMRVQSGNVKSACYDVFRSVFNSTGYKFKEPYIDTCKTCDAFVVSKRHTLNQTQRDKIDESHKAHVSEAQEGYDRKREDKANAKTIEYQRVLVFDLQQVLPVPFLTSNIAYYKRVLSMYNLTIRDCSSEESSECYMWSELQGGRGSEQIGSCILKKILELPERTDHLITYSYTCGGQNRNINIAVMFMFALTQKDNLEVIDQKFLLPGHTRLECDSDHARIERSKKSLGSCDSTNNKDDNLLRIMVPRDWCQFVRSLRGKKRFKVIEMFNTDFKAFSTILKNVLVHRTIDTEKNPVNWHSIKWLRYTKKEFGIVYFEYNLNPFSPFRKLNLIKDKKGRRICTENLKVPNSYSKEVGINPKKKKDLLSMLELIDKDYHRFYKNLPTNVQAREFDELNGKEDSEDEED